MAQLTPCGYYGSCPRYPHRYGGRYSALGAAPATLVVDGYRGELWSILSRSCSGNTSALSSEENELSKLAEDDVDLPAQLKSGERIKLCSAAQG